MAARGVVAAGHPETAKAGAEVLSAGGNAVDAAVASVLASLVAETLLTGLGAGGYMLLALPGTEARLLDFSVEAPGRGADPDAREELVPISVSFGDAVQVFNVGPASVGTYGTPAGLAYAADRFGSLPLAELAAPAVARRGRHCEMPDRQGRVSASPSQAGPRGRAVAAGPGRITCPMARS